MIDKHRENRQLCDVEQGKKKGRSFVSAFLKGTANVLLSNIVLKLSKHFHFLLVRLNSGRKERRVEKMQ